MRLPKLDRTRRPARRGAVALCLILVQIVLMLAVVGGVVADARDGDTQVNRLQADDAFYACDSGIAMAVREIMDGVDEDGDGGVGTISADNNPANDPILNSAPFFVTRDSSSGTAIITAAAGKGACRKKITIGVHSTGP